MLSDPSFPFGGGRPPSTRMEEKNEVPAFARPLVFPSRISHRRFTPKQHAFSYSYLMVRVPVGWKGCVGSFLSVDVADPRSRGWLHVDAADHLSRNSGGGGLRSKLDGYLSSQHVNPIDYPHAVLVCQPTFLGYQFNPASFWHLYSADWSFKAMIVEVNNTFDERRMYFLEAEEDVEPESRGSAAKEPLRSRLHKSWAKDFHVSPFNSRAGSYSITSLDPVCRRLKSEEATEARIDNTITLSTSDSKPKLVARAFSTENPLDPNAMSTVSKMVLILKWWWVGLMTFPRIVREAFRLFFQRKLHVWYRPEVLPTAAGRTATKEERMMEEYFRVYLQYCVTNSHIPISLRYTVPESIPLSKDGVIFTTADRRNKPDLKFNLDVTTPAFYSRLIHYKDPASALYGEALATETKNRTAWCSDAATLKQIFATGIPLPELSRAQPGPMVRGLASLASYLHVPPAAMSYPWPAISSPVEAPKAVPYPHSSEPETPSVPLDDFVLANCSPKEAAAYFRTVVLILLAEKTAFGSTTLLYLELILLLFFIIGIPWLSAALIGAMFGCRRVARTWHIRSDSTT